MPTQYGESVVMRLLSQVGMNCAWTRSACRPRWWKRFRAIVQRPNGLVLVTGPTGSGKTTTLYSALAELNSVEKKADHGRGPGRIPAARHQPGAGQRQDRAEFRARAALALRQDPDIVLVGEMRDQETAQIGLRAAMTGHLVLSTLHTNDAASTPLRLMDMGVPRYMVGGSLQAVLAQRLVRVICESCTSRMQRRRRNAPGCALELGDRADGVPLFHGRGCSHCNGMGYRGRTGVYELLEMTRAVTRPPTTRTRATS
jgi:MSHA biogenesis protein MshE